jgi:hypothetical protein
MKTPLSSSNTRPNQISGYVLLPMVKEVKQAVDPQLVVPARRRLLLLASVRCIN